MGLKLCLILKTLWIKDGKLLSLIACYSSPKQGHGRQFVFIKSPSWAS